MVLNWQKRKNLENSLVDFLQIEVNNQNLTLIDDCGNSVIPEIKVGFEKNDDWKLPIISVYVDTTNSPRLSIGSNKRQDEYLLIVDVRGSNIGQQLDLADWVKDTINNGWIFYEWSADGSGGADKVQTGFVSIDFISNTPIRFGENVDLFDKFRQNITISCCINILA